MRGGPSEDPAKLGHESIFFNFHRQFSFHLPTSRTPTGTEFSTAKPGKREPLSLCCSPSVVYSPCTKRERERERNGRAGKCLDEPSVYPYASVTGCLCLCSSCVDVRRGSFCREEEKERSGRRTRNSLPGFPFSSPVFSLCGPARLFVQESSPMMTVRSELPDAMIGSWGWKHT